MSEVVSRQPFAVESQLQSQASSLGFLVDKITLAQSFLQVLWVYPVSIIT